MCTLAALIVVTAFAYNAVPGQTDSDPGTSRCGRTRPGQVALSLDLWARGFLCGEPVTVNGRRYVVWDAMAAFHRSSVDVLVATRREADRAGRRTAILCRAGTSRTSIVHSSMAVTGWGITIVTGSVLRYVQHVYRGGRDRL